MCTIGGLLYRDKTFLLKSYDYDPFPVAWAHFETLDERLPHFALVNHGQHGINSGLNTAGLALQISRSVDVQPPDRQVPTTEHQEVRTVLNADVLARFSDVPSAVAHIEEFARTHPDMYGGNVMLADSGHLSVTEYFNGVVKSETTTEGWLARANHSVFGIVDNMDVAAKYRSGPRCDRMIAFLRDLFPEVPQMDRESIIDCCKSLLREPPILGEKTRSSFVIDVQQRRVDYMIGEGPWRTFQFASEFGSEAFDATLSFVG